MSEKLFAGLTYNQAVQKYSHTVAGVCVMRLQNYADAEDCYQNVFMKLFAESPQFSGEDHLKAWLIRVAINECKLLLRDNRRMIPLDSLKGRAIPFFNKCLYKSYITAYLIYIFFIFFFRS